MTNNRIVIALGGNALQEKGEAGVDAQQRRAIETARQLVPLIIEGYKIVIIHGNGPQVGDILLHEEALNTSEVPTLPLDSCVAMSQGSIGYWLQQAIGNELRLKGILTSIATIVTQVVVDMADPAFANPSKPIGPFYSTESEARAAADARGFVAKEDSGRGWRRVVPSPIPRSIVEKPIIESLINDGHLVIAVGGGGIPVIQTGQTLRGVEAVIDKDMSAAVLADMVGAEKLLILTSVDFVSIHFGTPEEELLSNVTCEDMRHYCNAGEFAEGSMLPKVLASLEFIEKQRGHRKVIITSLNNIQSAMNGNSGTIIS